MRTQEQQQQQETVYAFCQRTKCTALWFASAGRALRRAFAEDFGDQSAVASHFVCDDRIWCSSHLSLALKTSMNRAYLDGFCVFPCFLGSHGGRAATRRGESPKCCVVSPDFFG
jgi:hypothetical protein